MGSTPNPPSTGVAVAEVRVVTDSASASKVDGDIFMVHRSYTTIVARFNLFVKKGLVWILYSGICSIYSWLAFNPFMQRGWGGGGSLREF
jgi:hypothetical protein